MRLHSVLVLVAAFACASPLTVPEPPAKGPPVLQALEPAQAFAGQRLVLTGSGFDATPQKNEVKFGAARALAVDATEERLEVLVPEDAGPGPIVVTTPEGTSAPVPFTYLGLGHPRRGVETGRATFSFDTAWMGVAGGRTYAYSPQFQALVDVEDERVVALPAACEGCPADDDVLPVPLVLPGSGRLLLTLAHGEAVTYDPSSSPALEVRASHGDAWVTYRPSPAPNSTRLWRAIRPDRASAEEILELVDADSFEVVAGPLRATASAGLVPLGDTQALVGALANAAGIRWSLVNLTAGTSVELPELDGLEVVSVAPGSARAYLFGREGGVMYEVSGDGARIETRTSPVRSLFVTAATAFDTDGSTMVVAALVSQGLVVAFDPDSGEVRWSTTVARRPQALAFDPERGLVLVQDEEQQVVFGLTAAAGQPVWRTSLAPLVGLFSWEGGMFDRGRGPRGLVQTTTEVRPTALVSMPNQGGRSAALSVGTMSLGVQGSLPRADAFYEDGAGGALAYDALTARLATPDLARDYAAPTLPEALSRGPGGVIAVARAGRFIDVWKDGETGSPGVTWEEPAVASQVGEFYHLRPRGSGGWTAVRRIVGGAEVVTRMQLLAWEAGHLEAGQPPDAERTLLNCDGALALPGSYELLCERERRNLREDLSDGPVTATPPSDPPLSVMIATSPDGRMLASQEMSTIKLYRFAPGEPLVLTSVVGLPWFPTGLSFSATGEVLLVSSANAVLRVE